jgi:SAM-dependent methyltransferase
MSANVAAAPSDVLLASYDAVPYGGGALGATRPDYLAATAKLRGLDAPDAARCRVLDLGCATGGNLMAMALVFPESRFVGVDLSPRQIASGRANARQVGLDNVQFETMSITDVGDTLGSFDYIISHGVYSWVPEEVQTALLEVIAENLVPNGIAYSFTIGRSSTRPIVCSARVRFWRRSRISYRSLRRYTPRSSGRRSRRSAP